MHQTNYRDLTNWCHRIPTQLVQPREHWLSCHPPWYWSSLPRITQTTVRSEMVCYFSKTSISRQKCQFTFQSVLSNYSWDCWWSSAIIKYQKDLENDVHGFDELKYHNRHHEYFQVTRCWQTCFNEQHTSVKNNTSFHTIYSWCW